VVLEGEMNAYIMFVRKPEAIYCLRDIGVDKNVKLSK
jgi:hypothetical protein